MQASDYAETSFEDSEARPDEMHRTIDGWLEDLTALVDEAKATDEFPTWLDVQSRFHDYSYRNALLRRTPARNPPRARHRSRW
jgi:hypothetical protein